MALSKFLSKLNWRLLVIHFIACWFFIHAFQLLVYLYDQEMWEKFAHNDGTGLDPLRLSMGLLWVGLSKPIALLAGFTISLMLSLKYKWYWVNSIIVLLVIFLLMRFHLLGWEYLKYIFLTPGSFFKSFSIGYLLINGLLMLLIGVLLFFLNWFVRFIKNEQSRMEGQTSYGN